MIGPVGPQGERGPQGHVGPQGVRGTPGLNGVSIHAFVHGEPNVPAYEFENPFKHVDLMLQVFDVAEDGSRLVLSGYAVVITTDKISVVYKPAPQLKNSRKLLVLA
jgi:hypothetical protein